MKRDRIYPTDVTDRQWKILRKLLPPTQLRGRKIVYDRRQVINALWYVVRTGCQWRMLPNSFPPWKTVYQIFYRWRMAGHWQRMHDQMVKWVRTKEGRKAAPTAGIIDSQSVKTTEAGGPKGYDGGKKINGRKRHLVVDTLGLVLAVVVHAANQQDHFGATLVLHAAWEKWGQLVIFADSAYNKGGLPGFVRSTLGLVIEIVRKAKDAIGFEVIRHRWKVERTFSWIGRCRRHSKDYERNPETSEALIQIAMMQLMLRRLERLC